MSTKGQDVECANYPTLDHAPYGVKPIVMGNPKMDGLQWKIPI